MECNQNQKSDQSSSLIYVDFEFFIKMKTTPKNNFREKQVNIILLVNQRLKYEYLMLHAINMTYRVVKIARDPRKFL